MHKIFARGSTTLCRLIQRKFNQNIMLSNGSGAKSKTDHEKVAVWLLKSHPEWYRSSNHRCSMKKVVLRNFAKFTGKHLCQSLFLKKVAILRPFPVNFTKFLRTPFSQNTSGRLLLVYKKIDSILGDTNTDLNQLVSTSLDASCSQEVI